MWTTLYLLFVLCVTSVIGERVSNKTYYKVNTRHACFRRLNATHQIGCSSSRSGSVGVLLYMESERNVTWMEEEGHHDPYVILLSPIMFTREMVFRLKDSAKINGILVITADNSTDLPKFESPDSDCPNTNFELYKNDSDYKRCSNRKWNPHGSNMAFEDFDFPIVAISDPDEINFLIHECYHKFNDPDGRDNLTFPLCGAQVLVAMDAVKDTPTSLRKSEPRNMNPQSFCDPLGDYNVFGFPHAINSTETLEDLSVIVAAAKLDGLSMFEDLYPATETTVVGFVALLAAAEAIGKVKDELVPGRDRPIMFTFFQGETFDYMGSVRMLYDMEKGAFPASLADGEIGPHPIRPSHIGHVVEISQIGLIQDAILYAHSDPRSRGAHPTVNKEVARLIADMASVGERVGISVSTPPDGQPLPPASLQTFLKTLNLPGVVIADHESEYHNKYYNSRYDLPSQMNFTFPPDMPVNESERYVTPLAERLSDVATLVARALYQLSTGSNDTDHIVADNTTVAQLLYCFFMTPRCDMFHKTLNGEEATLPKAPYGFYVGIDRVRNSVSIHTRRLLALFLGTDVTSDHTDEKSCDEAKSKWYQFLWMRGSEFEHTGGRCIRSTVDYSLAKSPAFVEGYDWASNLYAGWSESVWPSTSPTVRVFLLPNPSQEILTLCVGLAVVVISLPLVIMCGRRASVLFPTPV